MCFTIAILAPISWIRTLETFRIGFIFAMIVILSMIILVITFEGL